MQMNSTSGWYSLLNKNSKIPIYGIWKLNFSKSLHRIVLAWIEIPTGVFLSKSVRWTGIIKNYFFYLIN